MENVTNIGNEKIVKAEDVLKLLDNQIMEFFKRNEGNRISVDILRGWFGLLEDGIRNQLPAVSLEDKQVVEQIEEKQ